VIAFVIDHGPSFLVGFAVGAFVCVLVSLHALGLTVADFFA
jgi:hypothetical protein